MNVSVKVSGMSELLSRLEEYKQAVGQKQRELCKRLADMGATNVSLQFARAIYTGDNDFNVSVVDMPSGGYQIVVSGQSVAFVEFGAGVTYGNGHPLAAEFGMGAGTYPSDKGHWDDPNGWYLPKEKWSSDGTKHTYGNPPNMPMYNTAKDLKEEIARVAREVFSS